MQLAAKHSATTITIWVIGGVLALLVLAAVARRLYVKRGLHEPLIVRLLNRISDQLVNAVKRPLTVAVLDEVADVLRAGHYTRNIASALEENREEIKQMVLEKIKDDPTAGRVNLIPFHDRIIEQASEATLRVLLEILSDPRTDELVSDVLRDNVTQIRKAVRERQT